MLEDGNQPSTFKNNFDQEIEENLRSWRASSHWCPSQTSQLIVFRNVMKYLRLLVVLCRSALLYPPSSMAEKAVTGFSSLSHQAFKLREAVSEVFLSHKKLMRLHFSHLFTLFLNGSILEIVQVILLLDRFSGLEKKPASPNKAAS